MTLGRFYCCYLRKACDLMPNFHPILFKFCAYVNYMLMYNMQRERKFPITITNLAALFLELFESPSYIIQNSWKNLYDVKKTEKLYECSEDGSDMKREKQSSGQSVVRRSAKYKIIIIVQYSAAITWYSIVTYVNRFVASMCNCTLFKD